MPLAMRTGPVLVIDYGQYTNDEKQPMTRRDGSAVEFVNFMVDGEAEARRITLDGSVNGSRVDPGVRAELLLESVQGQEARIGRSGRPYVARPIKFRVTGFAPAK